MYYSEDIIEQVRSRVDIVDVVSSCVDLKRKGGRYFGLCPFHSEKTASFSVDPGRQMYYCFGCHKGGNVISFVMDYENFTFPEALKALAERAGVELPETEEDSGAKKRSEIRKSIIEANNKAGRYYHSLLRSRQGRQAYEYLKRRGLTDETIVHWGLGCSSKYGDDLYRTLKSEGYDDEVIVKAGLATVDAKGARDRFWNRVMFPIMDANGRVIGFGGRVMGDAEPKYLNTNETDVFDKGRNLFGLNYARRTRENFMLLCEGYMDVISLHQAGFTNAVATLGTALTEGQANLLKRYTSNIILTYDSDGPGIQAAQRAVPILRAAGIGVKVLNMDPWKDPDEFISHEGADAFRERIRNADNFFLFDLGVRRRGYDMSDPEQKTAFEREAAKMLTSFEDGLERENYLRAVSARFDIPEDGLRRLVSGIGRGAGIRREDTLARRAEERENAKRRRADSGLKRSQRILLAWLAEEPALYGKIQDLISVSDFTEEIYAQTAEILFGQLAQGKADPAAVLDHFTGDPESARIVAEIFQSESSEAVSGSEATETEPGGRAASQARSKAFTDIVKMIRRHTLDEEAKNASPGEYARVLKQKKELEKLFIDIP